MGWSLAPPRQRLRGSAALATRPGESAFNGWLKIGTDDRVTVILARTEMGQGVSTALAMLVADELDARWEQIATESAPIDPIYNNIATVLDGLPFHPDDTGMLRGITEWMTAKAVRELGLMLTGGSSSIRDLWMPMREAGASARAMLIAAAAQRWSVPPAECRAEQGKVLHEAGRSASFGELAATAASMPLPDTVRLKTPAEFRLIGKPVPRRDASSMLDGSARFGIDAAPEGLLHARLLMCPTPGGRVAQADTAGAAAMPGVKKVVSIDPLHGGSGAIAVIADSPHRATRALQALKVSWDPGPMAGFSGSAFMQSLKARLQAGEEGFAFLNRGDADAAMRDAATFVEAEYEAPWLAHQGLEPMNCTVQWREGRAIIWAPTQIPDMARRAAAKALGVATDQVDLRVQALGGGFGRRLDVDVIAQAAAVARQLEGPPIQLMWTREQDMRHDFYRPACISRMRAGLDAQGQLIAWQARSAGQAVLPQYVKRVLGLSLVGPDKTTAEGAWDQPYEWPHARVSHLAVEAPVPVGFWRSVGHSHQAFFKECFLDEVAVAAGKDPVAFRLDLLSRHPRERAVLEAVAAMATWGEPSPPAADGAKTARGVALHRSFGATVAQIVEASLDTQGKPRVHRVWCAIDCGAPVNPQIIRQQMEGGILFGLSAALHGGVSIEEGQIRESNFHDQPVLRIGDSPEISTRIMDSQEAPQGVGEPPTATVVPALANALFALTGRRCRSLPLRVPAT